MCRSDSTGRLVYRYKQIVEGGKDVASTDFLYDRTSQRQVMDLCSHDEDIRRDKAAYAKFEALYAR